MGKTAISWTDDTWNPVRGCSRVSEGCRHCYAEQQASRIVRMGKGKPTPYDGLVGRVGGEPRWTGEVRLVPERLADPLRWREPRRIFVNSMSDLFHERLPDEHIAVTFGVMVLAAQHTYQVLTKRARRMREWFSRWSLEACIDATARYIAPNGIRIPGVRRWNRPPREAWYDVETWPVPWIWLGTSVENQEAADERIPDLLATPATVRFLSCEPMLGEVDIKRWMPWVFRVGVAQNPDGTPFALPAEGGGRGLDWVIAGCESGPGARYCSDDSLRSLRDQCSAASVPFFLKQAVHSPITYGTGGIRLHTLEDVTAGPGSKRKPGGVIELPYLDGVQHAAFPEVP